jgi:hypothetical protein
MPLDESGFRPAWRQPALAALRTLAPSPVWAGKQGRQLGVLLPIAGIVDRRLPRRCRTGADQA